MTDFTGGTGNDDFTGTADVDTFDMTQGGDDIVRGRGGDDSFNFGAEWTADDRIFGGSGTDALVLAGDYGAGVVFDHSNFRSIEGILLFGDFFFNLIFEDGALADGQTLEVDVAFGVGTLAVFAPETSAAFDVFAGDGNDSIVTGDGNDTINAGDGINFVLPGAGRDTILCGTGDDRIIFSTGELDRNDKIDGGNTLNNIVQLDGNYSSGVRLGETTLTNIQEFRVTAGHDYVIDFGKTHLPENIGLLIEARGLLATDRIDIDLSGTSGQMNFEGGRGNDTVTGNADDGFLRGGLGADTLEGGAGRDIHKYDAAADSTGKKYDTVIGFDTDIDIFTLDDGGFSAVGGIDATVGHGRLATATFNPDLKAAIGSGQLGAHHAVLFKPDSGSLAGSVFLVVDANGTPGYQKGADLVVRLVDGHHLGDLSAGDFFIV
jgi:Ca2+-binding RTX toxin-like protein